MLITEKFIFVHLPRTGGTFVGEVIRKFFPSVREIGHHLPRELMPAEYSHLPAFGTVRNPWEFYVSVYHYVLTKGAKSVLATWMSENGTVGVKDCIRNLVSIGRNEKRLDELIGMLPKEVDYSQRQIPNVSKETTNRIRGTGVGYYTFRFNEMFGSPDDMFFCRLETLKNDLMIFFENIGVATDEIREYVLSSPRKNNSEHHHYSTYYTPELAELVLASDHQLIHKFGYVFEDMNLR